MLPVAALLPDWLPGEPLVAPVPAIRWAVPRHSMRCMFCA